MIHLMSMLCQMSSLGLEALLITCPVSRGDRKYLAASHGFEKALSLILLYLFMGWGFFNSSPCETFTNFFKFYIWQFAELFDEQQAASAKQKGNGEPHYCVVLGSEKRNCAQEQ